LGSLAAADFAARLREDWVFARVTPAQKLRSVEALKANGEVVAMTDDRVNDAPALKSAHIRIAMGKRGTHVAREAADLVLLDDPLDAIVREVRLGRRIFANLRQATIYTLTVHVPIMGLAIWPLLFDLPLVLASIHIAFFELVIHPAGSIVFEAEFRESNGGGRPRRRVARRPRDQLLGRGRDLRRAGRGNFDPDARRHLLVRDAVRTALARGPSSRRVGLAAPRSSQAAHRNRRRWGTAMRR